MKRIFSVMFIFASILILSGCSIIPSSKQSSESSGDKPPASALTAKTQPGSLWRTSDGGQTFEVRSTVDETAIISKADILSIAYHPVKEMTIYVSSVNNGIFKTEDAGQRWSVVAFPPKKVYSFILDKSDPDNKMFASGVIGDWGKIFRTKNGGQNWDEVYTEPGQKTTVTALSQHPREANIIFAGTSTGTVIKSVDGGDTWKNVGSNINGIVSDISFDAINNLSTYLVSYNKKFYYSKDGGAIWLDWEIEKRNEVDDLNDRAALLLKKGNKAGAEKLREQAKELSNRNKENKMPNGIVSIANDLIISGTVYAGTNKGLFVSRDYGKYWYEVNIIESAKMFPIRSIAVNPKNSKEIVFVSGKAFYKSINGGETWGITGLNVDRDASFVSYDPFNSNYLFVGLRKF